MVKKAPKTAYCVTCKSKKSFRSPKLKTMKNGGKYYLGKCPRGHKVSAIVEGSKGLGPKKKKGTYKRKTPGNDNYFIKDSRKHRKGSGAVPKSYVWRKSYKTKKGKRVQGRYVKPTGGKKTGRSSKKTSKDDNFFRKDRKLHRKGSGVVPRSYRWKPRRTYKRNGKTIVVKGRWVPPRSK